MDVFLSLVNDDLDTDAPGYQEPLDSEEVTATTLEDLTSNKRRGG